MLEFLHGELPDRLQEREAGLAGMRGAALDQACGEERLEWLEYVNPFRAANRLRRFDGKSPRECGESPEQPPACLVQLSVAPVDRAAQRSLAVRQVDGAGGEDLEVVLELSQQRFGRE